MGGLRIGSGSAWWGDRLDPARLDAGKGGLDCLCFETMAEVPGACFYGPGSKRVLDPRDLAFPIVDVGRYAVDHLGVLNFVAQGALGGVSRSFCLDSYGKALSAAVLGFELDIPDSLRDQFRSDRGEAS